MNNTAHITSGRQRILIVGEHNPALVTQLKNYLKKFDNDVYISPRLPISLDSFDYCFIINDQSFIKKAHSLSPWKKVILILSTDRKKALNTLKSVKDKALTNIKLIFAPQLHSLEAGEVEEIIWFGVSKSPELFFPLKTKISTSAKPLSPKPARISPPWYYTAYMKIERFLSKKNLALLAFLCILVYHFAFVIPLAHGAFLLYKAAQKIESNELSQASALVEQSKIPMAASRTLYNLVRPSFLLFSVAKMPDDAFAIHKKIVEIINSSNVLKSTAHEAFVLILKKDKSISEKNQLLSQLQKTKESMSTLENQITFLNQKIPSSISYLKPYKTKLSATSAMIAKSKKLWPFLTELLANEGEKKYLLLFANNMELRPGGGFIGSYGVLTMKNLTFDSLQVYDVYDADGQLTAHVEPPTPIRTYLNQPHWFLRDSAFSPDFYDNYFQAKFFLDKEKQMTDFTGGIMITTTAIKNILKAYGDLYVPDFNEKVNSENFYLKTQLYAEKDFFPGSTQKKSFLSALTRQILVNLEVVPEQELAAEIFRSAEEKQLAFYFETEELQKIIDSYYWSGRIIEPQCPPQFENCYTDFLFPYDANLGVNKSNFFVNRVMETRIVIDSGGIIHTSLKIKFRNEAIQDVFPGGNYRNYFQLLIPRDSVIKNIMVGSEQLPQYDQEIKQFKQIGFFLEIPLQTTREVLIEYQSIRAFKKGKAVYQLLFQKQIGSINNDLSIEIVLPPDVFLVNQNFSPLVKHNQILYNTELSADKIFFIELLKE